ncbi:MAG TPA: prephenate dehydratase [Actinomycetota bacterium]|nr:prephenate dehydratase [Actinomycetota bacterium]
MADVVAYQGEPGAYSEEAAHRLFPDATPLPLRTLHQVFDRVANGELRAGVVPLENSQAGSITETFDLLARGDVHIVGEAIVRVDHALLALPGIPLEYVMRVASHPAALAQCQEFLATLDEEVEIVPVYDTAGAAKRIAEEKRAGEAAVASERAAQVYGLAVLAAKIQDTPDNFTRFAAVATDPEPLGPPDKTSLVLITDHRPGALFHALRPFAERGVNLVKLESRPSGSGPWKYRFYLDVEAGVHDPAFRAALEDLRTEAAAVQVLGSYTRWRESDDGAEGRTQEWSTAN